MCNGPSSELPLREAKGDCQSEDFSPRPRKPSEATQELLDELADVSINMGAEPAIAETVHRLKDVKEEQERFSEASLREEEHIRYEEMLRILASLGISIAVFGHEVTGAITQVRVAINGVEDA